jgi:hypothetical protein
VGKGKGGGGCADRSGGASDGSICCLISGRGKQLPRKGGAGRWTTYQADDEKFCCSVENQVGPGPAGWATKGGEVEDQRTTKLRGEGEHVRSF